MYIAGKKLPDGNLEISTGDPDVLFDAEDQRWKMWWSTGAAASYAQAGNAPTHIKYAESSDGVSWTVQEEPALRSNVDPTNWDDTGVETPTVIKVAQNPPDRRYVMFYAGSNDVDFPKGEIGFHWYQIGVAYSADGKKFTRPPASESPYVNKAAPFRKVAGLVLWGKDAFPGATGVEEGLAADPEVVYDGKDYHLLFSSYATKANRTLIAFPTGYGIGHATVTNLAAAVVTPTAGNPTLVGGSQPSVVKVPSGYDVFVVYDTPEDSAKVPMDFGFSYYGMWKHTSADLRTFSAKASAHEFTQEGAGPTDRYGMVKAGDMAYRDGIYRYYYVAFGSQNVPPGYYVPMHRDSGLPRPDGAIEFPDGGPLFFPAVLGIHVAARK